MLGIQLNPETGEPLYMQLFNALREAIEDGSLAPGERLPASRALAEELGVSRSVVIAGYQLLTASQLAWARVGSGTYVRPANRWSESTRREPARRNTLGVVDMPSRWNRPASLERPEWIIFGLDPKLLERSVK